MLHSLQQIDELESQFPGNSELAQLMRSLDWSQTDLPPPAQWPEELRHSVKLCLTSRIPIVIFWGPSFTMLYNDAYISMLGETKHPYFLGKSCKECWFEIWSTVEPLLKGVCSTGEGIWSEDIRMYFARKLPKEEVYIRFTYGPILDKDGKTVKGIFCPCTETTERVISARRLEILRKLSMRSENENIRNVKIACEQSAEVLSNNPEDIPFMGIYTFDEAAICLRLAASSGLSDFSLIPDAVTLSQQIKASSDTFNWPLISVFNSKRLAILSDLCSKGLNLPGGKWPEPTNQAIVIPIPAATQDAVPAGVLIVGVSSRRVLDEVYLYFFNSVARHIGTLIANAKIYEAHHRKDIFLAVLSHELRNPLASISNSHFVLSHSPTGSIEAERAQITIDRQLKQITRLVDDLLDLTRITQNKIRLRRQLLDVNKLVAQVVEDSRCIFKSAQVILQVKLADAPVFIHADPARIEQVISNLLQNAAKFSAPDGVTLISVECEKATSSAIIKVIDEGVGIEPDLLLHLFEPFMQADRSLDRNQGGLGLGLALVKGYVELHGGTVAATSDGADKGTEFIVKLPLVQVMPETNEKLSLQAIPDSVKRKVLIIDDNTHVAESLRMVLEIFGHYVYLSHNGVNGIQKARDLKPDFILCDIGLPDMDGYQIAKAIKSDASLRSIYLIALSGYAQPEDIEESTAAGFNLHLAKPPNLTTLKQILSEKI